MKMALKLRKDIKKSLYYVWFLGAKESKGLRGSEYVIPVIRNLEQREKEVEPFKVTLQVSPKGLKIIQNVVSQGKTKPKNETIKHFIPHNTITCVYQQEDIIACILLLFNPVTKCPLHIHAYRCDSTETASLLKKQLQILIDSPENQKKFAEIESRLSPPKEMKKLESSLGSDTGTSTRESESSEERYQIDNTRITNLYDSVAAELRAKLNKKDEPILLPPRDYDTVHRQKGNLTGIELRRCLNASIVGQNVKTKRLESSGGSSGIGSDHPPSPDSPGVPDSRFNTLDNHSTSDEEWNTNADDSALYLMQSSTHVTLPRPTKNTEPDESHEEYRGRYKEPISPKPSKIEPRRQEKYFNDDRNQEKEIARYLEKPIAKFAENKYLERQKSLERERQIFNGHKSLEKQNSRKSFEYDAPNKYYYAEYERDAEKNKRYGEEERRKYFEDDGFDESIRYRNSSNVEKSRYNNDIEETIAKEPSRPYPVPKTRQKYIEEYNPDKKYIEDYQREQEIRSRTKKEVEDIRREPDASKPKGYLRESDLRPRTKKIMEGYDVEVEMRTKIPDKYQKDHRYFGEESRPRPKSVNEAQRYPRRVDQDESYKSFEYFDDSTANRRQPQFRQRSPSPEALKVSPQDRFRDAKEKFLSMERERNGQPRPNRDDKVQYLKRHESMMNPMKDRYDDSYFDEPKPSPRHLEEVKYRTRETTGDRYRNNEKNEPKRRSMFNLNEEEQRRTSSEMAREMKRRSYFEEPLPYHDLPESDRYPSIDRDYYNGKSSHDLDQIAEMKYDPKFVKNQKSGTKGVAGYRHSYAEPKIRMEKKNYSEMLHRTNSTVDGNGRVGIASVHPY